MGRDTIVNLVTFLARVLKSRLFVVQRFSTYCTVAYASGTDACAEHTSQELMRALSILVRNWCVH
jgi:hypothetical protein